MKHKILLAVLLLSVSAFATMLPAPIAIQIATYDTEPITVTITNVNTGYSSQIDVVGQTVYDGMAGEVSKGQVIRVEVLGVVREQSYNEAPMIFSFDFKTGITPPVTTTTTTIPETTTTTVPETTTTIPSIQCFDGTIVDDISKCPQSDWATIITYIVVAVLSISMIGYGLKIYKKKDGSVAVQHKHKNIIGYHDTNIMHKYQPHKKGQIAPRYSDSKGSDGRYKYLS